MCTYMKETSEELGNKHEMTDKQKSAMIEFAKLHVTKALEAASENATIDDIGSPNCDGEWMSCDIVNKDSILSAYPLDNIK
jgi:hypothetical protein